MPNSESKYKASALSDGERAVFYMIGQVLVAEADQVLIVDEPELHIHRSIMSKLWDELEAARQDCSFVFITHDLEFAAARAAQEFVIREYRSTPTTSWVVEEVPEETGFGEDIATLILGSRRPILFVEGERSSLDVSLYRCCYPDWTVIPRSSCKDVLHAVQTMRANASLTRITCSGIVDGDHYTAEEVQHLKHLGIAVLPVCEIENIILLPEVSRAIAEVEGHVGIDQDKLLGELSNAIIQTLGSEEKIDEIAARYCKRRIDRLMKRIDLGEARTAEEIQAEFARRTSSIDVRALNDQFKSDLKSAIAKPDLERILQLYDNKGLMALAASKLKSCSQKHFESWLTRILRTSADTRVASAILSQMPKITPQ